MAAEPDTFEESQALNELLTVAAQPLAMEEMLGRCLDALLAISWLSLLPQGGIFLSAEEPDGSKVLRLVTERNLGSEISTLCAKVAYGHCLCGRAALTKVPVHASCVSERHEITYPGMAPHGHYNVPIVSGEKMLGVIVLYLPHGTERDDRQLEFLSRCAAVLGLAIELRRMESEVAVTVAELKYQKNALSQAQRIARVGSWSLDHKANLLNWSDQIYAIYGLSVEDADVSFETILERVHPDDEEAVEHCYQRAAEDKEDYQIEHRIVRKDNGEVRWVHEMCVHARDSDGVLIRSDGTVQDITDRRLAEDEVRRLAMTDQLTGLANRNRFNGRFGDTLKLARRHQMNLALMLLDLDRFKAVNDTCGHQVGDSVLRAVSAVFQHHSRDSDVVARIGGDEFAILIAFPESRDDVEKLAVRISEKISQIRYIDGHEVKIGVSIGVAMVPEDGVVESDLMRKADMAMYEAKRSGKFSCSFYHAELEEQQQ